MIAPIVFALAMGVAADLHVHAVDGCVAADDVAAAFVDDPIDVAELVTVSVLRNDAPDEPYRLLVTASLIGAPLLARETTLRPIECADVPALVRVWIMAQRATVPPPAPLPTPKSKPSPSSSRSPSRSRAEAPRYLLEDTDLDLAGPPSIMGLGLNVSVGPSSSGFRGAADFSYDVWGPFAVVAGADVAIDDNGDLSPGGQFGVRAVTRIVDADVSLRGLVIGGRGSDVTNSSGSTADNCLDDVADPKSISRTVSRAFFGPAVAARARYGWFFVEGGSMWRVGIDPLPGIYGAVGVTLVGR